MNPEAVRQAEERLERAKKALSALASATNHAEAEAAWIDFLSAASTFYSKLEQGAKSSISSQAWFNKKRTERKNDQLMNYLHQARNTAEHGIARVVGSSGNEFGVDGDFRPLTFGERSSWNIQALDENRNPVGESTPAWMYGPTIGFVPVINRGVRYEPPTQHCGSEIPLDENYVGGMGGLAAKFMAKVLEEARTLEKS